MIIFQINILATDNGYPANNGSDSARITLNIIRNEETPEFKGEDFETSIAETLDVDSAVMTIEAEDDDKEVRLGIIINICRDMLYFHKRLLGHKWSTSESRPNLHYTTEEHVCEISGDFGDFEDFSMGREYMRTASLGRRDGLISAQVTTSSPSL